jgi:hypothetical protein
MNKKEEFFDFLKNCNPNLKTTPYGYTMLMNLVGKESIYFDNDDIVNYSKYLIEKENFDPNIQDDREKQSAAIICISKNDSSLSDEHKYKIISMLIEHPLFNPNIQDLACYTVLMMCMSRSDCSIKDEEIRLNIAKKIIEHPNFNPNITHEKAQLYQMMLRDKETNETTEKIYELIKNHPKFEYNEDNWYTNIAKANENPTGGNNGMFVNIDKNG